MHHHSIQFSTSNALPPHKFDRLSPLWPGLLLSALACFAFSPAARAVIPAPDGGYPGQNTAEGTDALLSLNSGVNNTAIGFYALKSNDTGIENTASGAFALESNTNGYQNTASGVGALERNTTGSYNTATGVYALGQNTTGNENTASGLRALNSNTTGYDNTASGLRALSSNTTGYDNTANGTYALSLNTTGAQNTASGFGALHDNTIGTYNTAIGLNALFKNTTASYNTASGYQALFGNTSGTFNTANGVAALAGNTGGNYNTASGFNALASNSTGFNNVAVGYQAGYNLTTGSNNIDIGNVGVAAESGKIRIGTAGKQTDTLIAGIYGSTVTSGIPVLVGAKGKLGTVQSSARFKEAIKPMDKASESVLALNPVTFHYKKELDPEGTPQFGLIAEEVAKVNPDLIIRDEDGKVMTVRYEAVNAMLLNEFQKEHRKVEAQEQKAREQEATIAQLKLMAAQQQKEITALSATVRKVSDQVALSKPAPQMVVNNQ